MNDTEIRYKRAYAHSGILVALLGAALIIATFFADFDYLRYRTLRIDLPDGLGNLIVIVFGAVLILSFVHNLLKTRALNGNGGTILLSENWLKFNCVRGYRGKLVQVPYAEIGEVKIYTLPGKEYIRISVPNLNLKYRFNAQDLDPKPEWRLLAETLRTKAKNASIVER
ncbi:MAG: hypothetical protein LBO81_03075 [Clostridiales Family XIII bacterium]|jgi:hypothetical protein|nr:hypothetical protein [Clostridiales Family XIII bacterium]